MGVFIGFFERFWLVFSKKHSLLQHAYLYSVTSGKEFPNKKNNILYYAK
jgi:hypothetical protein